jgi:carboxyl-terminal processing protease
MKTLFLLFFLFSCATQSQKVSIVAPVVVKTTTEEEYTDSVLTLRETNPREYMELLKHGAIFNQNKTALEMFHLNKNLDALFLEKNLIETFIQRIDSERIIFTKEDINQLKQKHPYNLVMKTNGILLVKDTISKKIERLNEYKIFINSLSINNFNYNDSITIYKNRYKIPIEETLEQLKNKWIKNLQYRVLYKNKKNLEKEFNKRKEEIINFVSFLEKKSVEDFYEKLNSAYGNIYDAHSEYFSAMNTEKFQSDLTGHFVGLGLELDWDDSFSYVKIVKILEESNLKQFKSIKEDDLIIKIKNIEDDSFTDLLGVGPDNITKYVKGKAGSKIVLQIKHKDRGSIKNYIIKRKLITQNEAYAQGVVIKKNEKKIGYIYLPRFYRNFQNEKDRNCTDDIKKILVNFNREKIDSLILDLRNNYGGSLIDASYISGLFIKSGPIVQIKSENNIQVLEDLDGKSYYDRPMIVMVNKHSASASEIVAAALQDHKRALIIGGNNTHGKGSVQLILDYKKHYRFYPFLLPYVGSLKITTQKFYRITGETTQYYGVKSDIILPDKDDKIGLCEQDLPFSLVADKINSVFTIPDYYFNYATVIKESNERIKNNAKINEYSNYLYQYENFNKQYSIKLDANKISEFDTEFGKIKDKIDSFVELKNISFKKISFVDSKLLESLKKDIILEESINIALELRE